MALSRVEAFSELGKDILEKERRRGRADRGEHEFFAGTHEDAEQSFGSHVHGLGKGTSAASSTYLQYQMNRYTFIILSVGVITRLSGELQTHVSLFD